jgi:hypothetical protein
MLRIGLVFVISVVALAENVPKPDQKRFRPELWAGRAESFPVKATRSYCPHVAPESRAVTFRRCAAVKTIRLVPSLDRLPSSPAKYR